MKIFAISDLHLSLGADKPMDIFKGWDDYAQRLENNWQRVVEENDTVIINGDISWAMSLEEAEKDFEFLKANYPELLIYPTVHTCMRTQPRVSDVKTLAIGQKAAYFGATEYFVNIVEGGGYLGFEGILKLCRDMEKAFEAPKDTRSLIEIKGMGCCGCH